MKKLFSKILFATIVVLSFTTFVNGQSVGCTPPCNSPVPPCPACASCWTVNMVNNTNCDITFEWTYAAYTCSTNFPAGILYAGQSIAFVSPCRSFCDLPCECPTKIDLVQPTTPPTYWNAGNFNSLPTGTTIFNNVTSCAACASGFARLTIDYTTGLACTFTFDCQP